MTCHCAERRKALAEMRRAVVAGDKGEVKTQAKVIGRSVRLDIASLRRLVIRR